MAKPTVAKSVKLIAPLDSGVPGPEHFRIEESPVPTLADGDGGVVLQALVFSADPYLRGGIKSSMGAKPGQQMVGFIAGKVLESQSPNWVAGDLFGGSFPFTTVQVVSGKDLATARMWKLTGLIKEEEISYGIGVLGMPGSTAYGGFIDVLAAQKGETLFVSAASGAVGSLVGQIAKKVYNCKVIGSAGGPDKCKLITEKFGFDHAIDYKALDGTAESLKRKLKECAPEGIDMYFENVGGIHFDAAFACLRFRGRIAVCGAISGYNEAAPPKNEIPIGALIYQFQRIEGFMCMPWLSGQRGQFLKDMSQWLREGKLEVQETFFDGIEQWPAAFNSLFTGSNVGKVVVRVA